MAHAEVGSGEGGQAGGAGGGESGPDDPEGAESGGASNEAAMEAAMSSPITPLDQTWNGVLGGLAVSARYDAATQSVQSTVQNTLPQVLCYVQAEPHLKSGAQTVGELGPDVLGHLSPGQQATSSVAVSSVAVSSEPSLAGVSYDGYVVHLEVFDCAGPGPVPHTGGEGGEQGSGESGTESGSESGGEGGGSAETGEAAMSSPIIPLGESWNGVLGGLAASMQYDAATRTVHGTVRNTLSQTLCYVQAEPHLKSGTATVGELDPEKLGDLNPGQEATDEPVGRR